jgi:hypothetical protein
MARVPTVKQTRQLCVIANPGLVCVTPGADRLWRSLLANGWIEQTWLDTSPVAERGSDVGPCWITPDGLRALAAGLECHGRPADPPVARRISDGAPC